MKITLEFRDHRRDPEFACAAGALPVVVSARITSGSDQRDLQTLLRILLSTWPERRVTVEVPATQAMTLSPTLWDLGFHCDNTYGEGEPLCGELPTIPGLSIRGAELRDIDPILDLFWDYASFLNGLSEFTHYDESAAESLKTRLSAALPLAPNSSKRILVAELTDARNEVSVQGVIEASTDGDTVAVAWISVAPAMRGNGIGRALVAETMRQMAGDTLAASYLLSEQGPARFWHRLGLEDRIHLFEAGAR